MHSNRYFLDTTTLEVVYPVLQLYRPQTKFVKVMFLHTSVILSTRGGGVSAPGGVCSGGVCSQIRGLLQGVFAPRGVYSGGNFSQGVCWGGSAPRGTGLLWRVSAPGACLLWGGGLFLGGSPGPSTRDSYSCRRYASYWNAFLFYVKIY